MMILQLAWRNIWRNPIRSLVIILSVAAGLFAAIAVLALYDGMLSSRLRTVIDTETGHIQLHDPRFREDMEAAFVLPNGNQYPQKVLSDPRVRALALRVLTSGMLATASGSSGVNMYGIDEIQERKVSQWDKRFKDTASRLKDSRSIVIGKKLSTKLNLQEGDKVVLTMTDKDGNMVSAAMRIRGIYETANTPLDEVNVFMRDETLAELLGIPGQRHEMVVVLHADDSLEAVQSQLKQQYPALLVESWKALSPETDLMINTVDYYSYIIVIIILVALSFGIVNTMMMSVLERRKEIAMMTALGIGSKRMLWLITIETVFLTMVGIPVAILVGWLVVDYFHRKGLDLSGMGEEMMKSFGFENLIYPGFPVEKLPAIILLVFISALLASVFPAVKSLRIDPARALQK